MRVVYDYGLGFGGRNSQPPPALPGGDPPTEVVRRGSQSVMIIRVGERARDAAALEGGLPADGVRDIIGVGHEGGAPGGSSGISEDGLRLTVAGRDYLLTVSPEARMREQAVRLHESAHARVLGAYAESGISYTTERGPDGRSYVTGGSIKADLSEVPGDPRATLRKARTVIAAAHAVGDPSAADMRVAAEAYRMARDATDELREIARA